MESKEVVTALPISRQKSASAPSSGLPKGAGWDLFVLTADVAPYQKNEQRLVWGVMRTIQLLLVRDCGAEELPRKQRQSQSKRFANR